MTTATALARYDDTAWQQKLEAYRSAYAPNLTNAELEIFGYACRRLGLDPAAKQIYAIKDRDGKVTTMVAVDGYRSVAEDTEKYDGQVGPFWCGPDGEWKDQWLSDTPPVAAKVGIRRRDFSEIMWGFARYKAFVRETPTWKKMPEIMLAVRAEMQALRKTFPSKLGGTYTPGEIDESDQQTYIKATITESPAVEDSRQPAQEPTPIRQPTPRPSQQHTAPTVPTASPADDLSIGEFVRAGVKLGMNSKQLSERLGVPQQDFHTLNRRETIEKLAGVVETPQESDDDGIEIVEEDHSEESDESQDEPYTRDDALAAGELNKLFAQAGVKSVAAKEAFLEAQFGDRPFTKAQAVASLEVAIEASGRTPDLASMPQADTRKGVH